MAALKTRMGSLYVSSINSSIASSKKATRSFSKIADSSLLQRTTKKSHRFHHYPSTCHAPSSYVHARANSTATVALEAEAEDDHDRCASHQQQKESKHCKTCTCEKDKDQQRVGQSSHTRQELSEDSDPTVPVPPCGIPSIYYNEVTVTQTEAAATALLQQQQAEELEEEEEDGLPPPLPEPGYSVRRRLLSDCSALTALDCQAGQTLLIEALQQQSGASYIPLTQHFTNQSEPAYCGVTTLLMVLNALAVDPGTRWRGGWRYYGDENVLLSRCCLSAESIRRVGISMPEFAQLAACQGLRVTMKQPVVTISDDGDGAVDATAVTGGMLKTAMGATVDDFRRDIRSVLCESDDDVNDDNDDNENDDDNKGILVVSFARYALGQTGDGHFSPIAAYHEATDQCLVLDVARFKYQPYWVSVTDLFKSTVPLDNTTQKPRGWYILQPPVHSASYKGTHITTEDRRPANLVPTVEEGEACPVHEVKLEFCPVRRHGDSS